MTLFACCLIVFAETGILLGFFLPGDSLVFVVGMVSGMGTSPVPLWIVCAAIAASGFLGDQTGMLWGRRAARLPAVQRKVESSHGERIERARVFFARHGGSAIVLARFVPLIRTFVPFTLGLARFDRSAFLRWNTLGALLWGTLLPTAGRLLGGIAWVTAHVDLLALAIVVVSLVPLLARSLQAHRRHPISATMQSTDDKAHGGREVVRQ